MTTSVFVADLTDDAARQRLHGFHYPIGGNRFFTLFACQYVDTHPALSKMTVGLYSQCMGGNKAIDLELLKMGGWLAAEITPHLSAPGVNMPVLMIQVLQGLLDQKS